MQFFIHCNFFCQEYTFTYLLTLLTYLYVLQGSEYASGFLSIYMFQKVYLLKEI